jgi:sugar/nucleoside kinase (ribokinase family)
VQLNSSSSNVFVSGAKDAAAYRAGSRSLEIPFTEMGNVPSSASAGTTLLAVGDPVLDIVSDCPASFVVESLGFALGGCDLIDEDALEDVVDRLESASRTLRRIPGGSAANVAKCFARLSSGARRTDVYFAGTLGRDASGKRYRRQMEAAGVKMRWSTVHPSEANGVCLCMVTESGERTMRTALRASRTHELPQKCIDALRPTWVHFEGTRRDTDRHAPAPARVPSALTSHFALARLLRVQAVHNRDNEVDQGLRLQDLLRLCEL